MSDALMERLDRLEGQLAKLQSTGVGAVPSRRGRMGGFVCGVGEVPEWAKRDEKRAERIAGLGAPSDSADASAFYADVYEMLILGSPRFALCKALGIKLVPFVINVRATFTATDTTDIPDVGSDVKVTQETLIDEALVRITNQSNTANSSVFQPQSDYFYNVQSGIECTLDVQGAPRYTIVEKFTPLATVFDTANGSGLWPQYFVLTYQQQFFMSFHAAVTLPYAPLDVTVSWRAWVPQGDFTTQMSNGECMDRLADVCGIVVTDAYRARIMNYPGGG
jgi:hypothetical protein